MSKIWRSIGIISFWLTWPGLWLMLRWSERTRLLLICGNEFLVVRGWLGAGEWGLPGGGLHKGEAAKIGLLREVREETSIILSESDLIHAFDGVYRDKGLRFNYHAYTATIKAKPDVKPQAREIAEIAWCPLNEPDKVLNQDTQAILKWLRTQP